MQRLREILNYIGPVSTTGKDLCHPELSASAHVFLRRDASSRLLQPLNDGPFPELRLSTKLYTLQVPDRWNTACVDCLKPASTNLSKHLSSARFHIRPSSPSLVPTPILSIFWAQPLASAIPHTSPDKKHTVPLLGVTTISSLRGIICSAPGTTGCVRSRR